MATVGALGLITLPQRNRADETFAEDQCRCPNVFYTRLVVEHCSTNSVQREVEKIKAQGCTHILVFYLGPKNPNFEFGDSKSSFQEVIDTVNQHYKDRCCFVLKTDTENVPFLIWNSDEPIIKTWIDSIVLNQNLRVVYS